MRVERSSMVLVSLHEETGELGLAICSLPCEDTAGRQPSVNPEACFHQTPDLWAS